MKDNCKCGAISSHTTFKQGKEVRLCCACYVKAGNPPADWHIGCMREYGREKEVVAPPHQVGDSCIFSDSREYRLRYMEVE